MHSPALVRPLRSLRPAHPPLTLSQFPSRPDLQFLDSMFATGEATGPSAQAVDAVLGQPVDAAAAYAAPIPTAEQQQQQLAALQFSAGMLGAPAGAYPPATALQQQYTQAILQQHMMAQLTHGVTATTATAAPTSKRGKTAAEVAEQEERIKRRRRESAQRSRQRKSAYVKTLEGENQSLKVENERLRRELVRLGRPLPPSLYNVSTTSGSSAGLADAAAAATAGFASLTGGSSDGVGLCPVDCSGLGTGAAQELMGMAL
jgi:hypothetical protein